MQNETKVILDPAEYYKHMRLALRYRFIGLAMDNPEYNMVLRAMEFGERHHTGVRKDGVTPEYMHQIEIVSLLVTYHHAIDPALRVAIYCCGFLHDVSEDYGIPFDELRAEFNEQIATSTIILSKTFRGQKMDPKDYHEGWWHDLIASIVKLADRLHNLKTMRGVYDLEKQMKVCLDTRENFFPGIVVARRKFPQHETIYENMKTQMEVLCCMYESANAQGIAL